jgi:hypothetical protein
MLLSLVADALFCAAFFFETLAALSFLQAAYSIQLREEFTPILQFYHETTSPLAFVGANLLPGKPVWYADAYVIGAVLFFLFFIRQAQRAMAPYAGDSLQPASSWESTRLDAAIDRALPAAACAIGAAVAAFTLLPFLTIPAALVLLLKRLLGKPCWFKAPAIYYVNIVLLAGVVAAVFALAR